MNISTHCFAIEFNFRLFENETKTRMRLFSDHMGVIIDRLSVGQSNENVDHATAVFNMHGVRISPRQSPVYQPMVR